MVLKKILHEFPSFKWFLIRFLGFVSLASLVRQHVHFGRRLAKFGSKEL